MSENAFKSISLSRNIIACVAKTRELVETNIVNYDVVGNRISLFEAGPIRDVQNIAKLIIVKSRPIINRVTTRIWGGGGFYCTRNTTL